MALSGDELTKAVRHGTRVFDLAGSARPKKPSLTSSSGTTWARKSCTLISSVCRRTSGLKCRCRSNCAGIAPGVTGGGVLDQPLHELSVECLAVAIPESIRVSIAELQLGQSIHVRDLKLPDGVVAVTPGDAIVVHVTMPQAEPEPGSPGRRDRGTGRAGTDCARASPQGRREAVGRRAA